MTQSSFKGLTRSAARETSSRRNAPILLCLKGHPGTGKSTLARALCRRLNWPLLDKDDIKDHTWTLADGNELSYAILWQMVETQLSNGLSVIVDSPLARPQLYETVKSLAKRNQARLLIVQSEIDEATWKLRLEKRSANPSPHKPSSWQDMEKQLAIYNGVYNYPIADEHLFVANTGQPMSVLLDKILRRLGKGAK